VASIARLTLASENRGEVMFRSTAAVLSLAFLTACGGIRDDLADQPEPLGNFLLGHNIVVANAPQMGPLSREATDAEWKAAVETAIADRLGEPRFDGNAYFHIGTTVQGYVLAMPGIPVLYAPQSVLVFSLVFFEDATQKQLNPEPIQLTVFEPCCSIPLVGSGLTKSKEQQLEGLAFNAAKAIEQVMRENGEWFGATNEVLPDDPTIIVGNALEDEQAEIVVEQIEIAEEADN